MDIDIEVKESDQHHKDTNTSIATAQIDSMGMDMPRQGTLQESKKREDLVLENSPLKFNNQNTILMVGLNEEHDIMLQHDTRIFYFKRDTTIENNNDAVTDVNEVYDALYAALLGMVTTKKYRVLQTLFLIFKFTDTFILFSLIFSLFFSHTDNSNDYLNVFKHNYGIFLVFLLEIFYDITEFNVKIWILNRVSIYIGFSLYILYCIALKFTRNAISDPYVYLFLSFRFIFFLIDESIAFCIDKEIHYDLRNNSIRKFDLPACLKFCQKLNKQNLNQYRLEKTTGDLRSLGIYDLYSNTIQLPSGWKYKGSVCSWTFYNVFLYNSFPTVTEESKTLKWHRVWLQVILFFTFLLGIPLMFFVALCVIILTLIRQILCCGACGEVKCHQTIFGEFAWWDSF